MSNADFMKMRGLVATVIGAGLVVGAAGIFLYHKFYLEKKRKLLEQALQRLDLSVSELQLEISALRNTKINGRRPRRSRSIRPNSEYDSDDMFSAIATSDEEYYDLSGDESDGGFIPNGTLTNHLSHLERLFQEVDALSKGDNESKQKTYDILKKYELDYSDDYNFLWRFAKAHHARANLYAVQNELELKKNTIFKGVEYAQKALQINPDNADVNKWFAILIGTRSNYQSTKDKIQDGSLYIKHVQIALKLKPEDFSLHHLLGRFKFEILNISWIERKVASALFAKLPAFTYEETIKDFKMADELNPVQWKENKLYIAKCYLGAGQYSEAIAWLENAKDIPAINPEDKVCDIEIAALLKKHKQLS